VKPVWHRIRRKLEASASMNLVLRVVRVEVRIYSLGVVEQLRPRSRHVDGVRARLLERLCCSYL